MKQLTHLFYSAVIIILATCAAVIFFDTPFVQTLFCLIVISAIVPRPKGVASGVVLEQWAAYIMERFWKDNAFLKNVYDDSQYVVGGRIIHIPQPGAKPNVVKNRGTYPATAVRRADTDVVYALDEYSTDPTHIPNIDAIHLSYNKQDSVLGDHMAVLNETVADDLLIKWGANGTVYKTTGVSVPGNAPIQVGPVTGQTGNRLGFTHRDLKNLMILFNVNKVPKTDRFVLIDDSMFDGFYDTLGDTNAKDFSRYADAENGVIGKLHSFNVMTRSSVMAAANDNTIKPLGSSIGATDNLVSLAWHKNSIAQAIGDIKFYQNINDALYQGDVHSATLMAGGRVRRADDLGLVKIIQGTPA